MLIMLPGLVIENKDKLGEIQIVVFPFLKGAVISIPHGIRTNASAMEKSCQRVVMGLYPVRASIFQKIMAPPPFITVIQ